MLTDAELAWLRAAQEALMTETATISRSTRVPDGMGGMTDALAVVASAVPCRRANTTGSERTMAERLSAVNAWTISLPAGTNVAVGDQISVSGLVLRVRGVLANGVIETARRCICEEIR